MHDEDRAMYDPCRIDSLCAERDRLERHRAQEAEMSMMRCSECDAYCDTDDGMGEWVGDDYVCDSCVEELSVECVTCGEYFLPHEGETTCKGCSNVEDGGDADRPA